MNIEVKCDEREHRDGAAVEGGGWRGELDGNVGFLPWRMTLKTTAEHPNIFGRIRTLHSAPGFQNITVMEDGLSVSCGVSRLVTLRVGFGPSFKVFQSIKWKGLK